ncbi:DivIVA domain-containing protein [Pengzhenrongella sicca]|uniref:DivIVA domain-containing protein n=1 Tax=Pengzhenrongella sicca TaxID=2819238 RepID=A0A8A4ZGP4_9MICO|nr:DivIVA domain-containing protein [Pengzhenrongella sicca]QTE30561.1 DivIVA domain-containing protein [Pengzhenrongella sicca]
MSKGMFRTVSKLHSGYATQEVDEFFDLARRAYEGEATEKLTGREVRATAFDVVRGGYSTGAVDAALDRLEAAFVARTRQEFVAAHGQQAWMVQLADGARTLYGRLTRPDGERFAPAHRGAAGYEPADVDALCRRLVAYFDRGEPLTAQEVRSATFRRRHGAKGYGEAPVDAFFDRAVEVLLGVE